MSTSATGGNLIKLFIVGAQKAGTTSLKHYLGEHPQIMTHLQKEFAYFYDDAEFAGGETAAFRKYFGGDDHPGQILVAKNAGLYVKESGIKRLSDHNPRCKIVLILRNPVDRAYSAFQMEKNHGNCSGEFDDLKPVFEQRDSSDWRYEFFIKMGMYAEYVRMLHKYFPPEQLMIIRYDDFASDNKKVCHRIFEWLSVSSSFTPDLTVKHNVTHLSRSKNYARMVMRLLRNDNQFKRVAKKLLPSQKGYKIGEMLRNINKTTEKPEGISLQMAAYLSAFYEPFNRELAAVTGEDFSSWNNQVGNN